MLDPERLVESLSNHRLHLILMATEACNLHCAYCYEDFRLGRMQPRVIGAVKRLIARRVPELRELHVEWFGGEPLLACDVIDEIMLSMKCEAQRHPNLVVTSSMTTNAYTLSVSTFRRLLRLGVTSYQVTFDGPKQWHDSRRVRASGEGSFDQIWRNLAAMRSLEEEFSVTVRLHVDRDNVSDIPEFLGQFQHEFAGDPRFRLYIRRLAHLGGPNDSQYRVFEHAEAELALRELKERAAQLGIPQEGKGHGVCYAAKSNSLVIRADGRVNKCTVALEHPNNQVGRIDAEGHVDQDTSRMWMWMRGLWSGDEASLECPMRGYADPVRDADRPNVVLR